MLVDRKDGPGHTHHELEVTIPELWLVIKGSKNSTAKSMPPSPQHELIENYLPRLWEQSLGSQGPRCRLLLLFVDLHVYNSLRKVLLSDLGTMGYA